MPQTFCSIRNVSEIAQSSYADAVSIPSELAYLGDDV